MESSWVASLFRGSTFWRAVEASWKPLRRRWGDLLGLLGGLRGLIWALLTALGAAERPPESHLGAMLDSCWAHVGAPGASFSSFLGVPFEPRARSARQTKALVEITGQKVFRDRCGPDVQRPLSTKLLN